MAETATDSAPNGRKLEEEAKAEQPENAKVTTALTEEKTHGDLKASPTKTVKEQDAGPDNGPESAVKTPAGTKASGEAVAKETSDLRKGDEVADVKAAPDVNIDQKNAEDLLPETHEAVASLDAMPVEAKENIHKDEQVVKPDNFVEQKDTVAKAGDVQAMDIDDKKQEEVIERVDTKEKQVADVAPSVKKKLGRPKKIKVPEVTKGEKETKEESTPVPVTKKRRRQKRDTLTPLSERDRPSRERKSIERFVASVEKGKKELVIKQGSGTQLMEIPNVVFKLSKRAKGDDILHMLHSLLYNKRAKANVVKSNIFRFSGYVWTDNEEKERSKVREKLERCTKEGLGQLIDVLDLHLNKTGKKEELVAKVLEFLESPHKTTDVSLAEREQKLKEKKRKNRTPGRGRGLGGKRRKLEDSSSSKKRGRRKKSEIGEASVGEYGDSDDESLEEEEEVERKRLTFVDDQDDDEDDDDVNDEDYEAKHKPSKKLAKPSKQDVKEPDDKISNEDESEGEQEMKRSKSSSTKTPKAPSPDITRSSSKPAEKVYTKGSRKKSKELQEKEKEKEKEKEREKEKEKEKEKKKEKEKESTTSKRAAKQKSVIKEEAPTGTGRGRRGKTKEAKEPPMKKNKAAAIPPDAEIPPDEVLQGEIRNLLKDLNQEDFSRVTYMDIVLKLEKKFKADLSVQKAHVKLLIRQELSKLAEENEEEDEEQEGSEEPEAEEAAEGQGTDTKETGAAKTKVDATDSSAGEAAKVPEADASDSTAAADSTGAKKGADQGQSTKVAEKGA